MSTRRTLLAALVLLFAHAPAASAGDGRFRAGEEFSVARAYTVATGDFNADGRADLAAVSYAGGYVAVRLGRAGGGFDAAPNVVVGADPTQIAIADFNADGKEDLAVGNVKDRLVSVHLGVGDGRFTDAPDLDVGRVPFGLVVGDFNADGREDLAIANANAAGSGLRVRLGAGDGTFVAGGDMTARAAALAVGDFDSDGIEDLAFGAFGSQPAGVLAGKGGGVFAAGPDIALPDSANSHKAWAVGDFDADGRADVAAAVSGTDVVSVRFGTGAGTFAPGRDLPVGDSPYTVSVGDFNADGNEDLAVANSGAATVSVRLGAGDGGFRAATDVAVADRAHDVAIADFDGDGNDDLAVASFAGGSVSVRYGVGTRPLAGNLLVNGGFEGPGAAAVATQSPPVPGWERTGGMTFARYGLPSHAYFPSRLAAPRYATGALNLLWGGNSSATGGVTTAFQSADVSRSAAAIDDGRVRANLYAFLGGALAFDDRMDARAAFLGAGGRILGSFGIGPVTAADRRRLTTLVRRAARAALPVGTRRIRVTLTSIDDDKTYSSATADNVKLTLDVSRRPLPPPSQAFGADARVTLAPARIASKRAVRVRVRNRNPFAVTGTLRARSASVALKTRRLELAAGGARVVRLTLPKPLRRQLNRRRRLTLRLTAVVRDPAGNTRSVRARVRVRRA